MHCCWEGIAAQLTNMWFNTKNHMKAWYIGAPHTLSIINTKWNQIQIPLNFRSSISPESRTLWKGLFLFYI
jgi:hypothetical protein